MVSLPFISRLQKLPSIKIELHHIEKAVRPQFVWIKKPGTLFDVHPKYNHDNIKVGIAVFAVISKLHGHETEEIALYTGTNERQIIRYLAWFKVQMQQFSAGRKTFLNTHVHLKAWMVINYLRLYHKGDMVSVAALGH